MVSTLFTKDVIRARDKDRVVVGIATECKGFAKKIKVRTKCDTHCFAKVRKCDTSVSPSMKI